MERLQHDIDELLGAYVLRAAALLIAAVGGVLSCLWLFRSLILRVWSRSSLHEVDRRMAAHP